MVGIDRKNENSAAARLVHAQHQRAYDGRPRPADTPGIIARHWKKPDPQRFAKGQGPSRRDGAAWRPCGRPTSRITPPRISMMAIRRGRFEQHRLDEIMRQHADDHRRKKGQQPPR
jgi:hypothetical protein